MDSNIARGYLNPEAARRIQERELEKLDMILQMLNNGARALRTINGNEDREEAIELMGAAYVKIQALRNRKTPILADPSVVDIDSKPWEDEDPYLLPG